MSDKHILKIGDPVTAWNGFSNPDLRHGTVTSITLVEDTCKDGTDVPAILWDSTDRRDVVVGYRTSDRTPAKNYWAYGTQLVRPQ